MRQRLLFIWLALLFGVAGANAKEAYAYFEYADNSLNFRYDNNKGTYSSNSQKYIVYSLNTGASEPAWHSKAADVQRVYFFQSFADYSPTSCYEWFDSMSNLSYIQDLSYLNTSNVTNMRYMFWHCSSLASIDLSKFNTTNVTNMGSMFAGCTKLTTLDVSMFNTTKVTNMSYMFYNCSNLTTITGLNHFYSPNLTTVESMFEGCSKLTSLYYMSEFTVSSSTTTTKMLSGCSSLKEIYISSSMSNYLDASACSGVASASSPCTLYYATSVHPSFSTVTPDYVVWKGGYFKSKNMHAYAVLNGSKLTFWYDDWYNTQGTNYSLNNGGNRPGWYSSNSPVTTVEFHSSFRNARPTSCNEWFEDMTNLTSITGMTAYLNTSKVTTMRNMFYNCKNLTSIDVSGFNTSNVTTFSYMFYNCSKLTSLNLSSFNFSNLTNDGNMLSGCSALKTLTIPSTAGKMASNDCIGVGTTSSPCALVYPSGFTPTKEATGDGWFKWKSGYFLDDMPYAHLSSDKKTLTFYYDRYFTSRPGYIYSLNKGSNTPGWHTYSNYVTKVVFDFTFSNARPTSCYQWFDSMSNLTYIDNMRTDLNTSQVTNMAQMFAGCSSLNSVDVSQFNTSNVTDMRSLFGGCFNLTSISAFVDWNTSNVTDMSFMFYNCKNLTSIVGLWVFNTSKVTEMAGMFQNCSKLTALDLSSFNMSNLVASTGLINNCSALKTLKVSSTANKINSNACTGVGTKTAPCTLIYPSDFTPETTETGDGWYKWKSGYFKDNAPVESYAWLSSDGKKLTFCHDCNKASRSGTTYALNTGTNSPGWYDNRAGITSVVFNSAFADATPTSCYRWFYGMTSLTGITGLQYLNTEEVTNMASMFNNCSSLMSIDLSKFNTSSVTSMNSMFYKCSKLTTLDLGSFDTESVKSMKNMFAGCTKLTEAKLYSEGYIESGFGGPEIPVCVTDFVTTNVTDMTSMFENCSSLGAFLFPGLALKSTTATANMCKGCTAMEVVYVTTETLNSLDATAFDGVGSTTSCRLEMEDEFTPDITSRVVPYDDPDKNGYVMWKGGKFVDFLDAYAVYMAGELTFYYDRNLRRWHGAGVTEEGPFPYKVNIDDNYPLWNKDEFTVTKVVFDASFKGYKPNTTKEWFYKMTSLKSITNLKYLDTSEVKDMTGMFTRCTSLTSIDLSNFNTAKVTCFAGMFEGCSSLKSLDVSKFNTANATGVWGNLGGMMGMFRNCSSLTTLDLSNFNTSKVESMGMMFQGCSNLESVNLSSFNTSKVNYFAGMFMDCPKLTELDLSNFDFSQIEGNDDSSSSMMKNCTGLNKLTIPATASYLAPDACTGVGTSDAPCTFVYPSGFTPTKDEIGDGWFKWKSGYFASASGGILGDANNDGTVSVNDVQMVVAYILGKNPLGIVLANCDVTGEGEITVKDVSAIVNIVLSGAPAMAPHARESLTDMVALTASGGRCSLHLDNSEPYHAFQLEVVLPEGGSIGNVQLAQGRANGHHAEWNEVMPGRYIVVVYSSSGEALRDGATTALMHFDIAGCKADDVSVEGIQMVDGWCKTVLLPSTSGVATGISWVVDDASEGSSTPYYNTVGVGFSTPQRGVNIKDGRKVVKK